MKPSPLIQTAMIMAGVGTQWGYDAVIGAVVVGGIIEGLLGIFAKYWRRIISPIVGVV